MDVITKEKIRIYKKNNEGTNNYYKIIKLENKYKELDENTAFAWIFLVLGSMMTFLMGFPILLIYAIITTAIYSNKMKKIEEELEVLIKN